MLVIDSSKTLAEQELLALMSTPAVPDLLRVTGEPLMVKELSCRVDVPLSTAYQGTKRLYEASLFEKFIIVDHSDDRHVAQYYRTFERMEVNMADDGLYTELAG